MPSRSAISRANWAPPIALLALAVILSITSSRRSSDDNAASDVSWRSAARCWSRTTFSSAAIRRRMNTAILATAVHAAPAPSPRPAAATRRSTLMPTAVSKTPVAPATAAVRLIDSIPPIH